MNLLHFSCNTSASFSLGRASLAVQSRSVGESGILILPWITRLGFGRDAMDRVANHRTSKVTDVYDRHGYADEDKRIMAAVARHVLGIVEGTPATTVVSLR